MKVTMPLPRHFRQTPQAAEHVSYATTVRMLKRKSVIKPDCMAVVRAAEEPLSRALAAKRKYAGITMDARTLPGQTRLVEKVEWVKAHRSLTAEMSPEMRRDIIGNNEADEAAKEGMRRHPKLPLDQERELEYHCKRAPHVVKAGVIALALSPP